ncbi:hypothetical protein WBG99_32100 [Streptomyces sp. TG1A-60]|uniref:hypothetical protein n=1 Tax=Streptomyces sp. TG1A-60 TaxID=3129111 RepID=UPI0030CB399B
MTVAGRISRRLAIPTPPGLSRLREQADAWEERLRKDAKELTYRLSRHGVDAAVATVDELGRVQPDILIHGESHVRNICAPTANPEGRTMLQTRAVGAARMRIVSRGRSADPGVVSSDLCGR